MKFFDRVLAVGALIYAALFLSVVSQNKGLFSSDMASWVQAFGSIAAMWVAYSLARVASRESDRRRREDQIAVTAAAIELVVEIVSVFDDARETFESRSVWDKNALPSLKRQSTVSPRGLYQLSLSGVPGCLALVAFGSA